jgi:hypothetical protein
MDQIVSEGQASRRFNTVIISSFAAAAVLLSLLGIYSVIAFSAALRTREMAIRLALGSQRASVMRLVLALDARRGAGSPTNQVHCPARIWRLLVCFSPGTGNTATFRWSRSIPDIHFSSQSSR